MSVSDAIRIGDRVKVENEVGLVEEIMLTYVVVKVWDERRLVLPIMQFAEKPFQNWTKTSEQLMGDVVLHVDYRAPVEVIREEFLRLVRNDPDWHGDIAELAVVDATDKTLVLRGIGSANVAVAWNLRCRVREELVKFLQKLDGGAYLPRHRLETRAVGSP